MLSTQSKRGQALAILSLLTLVLVTPVARGSDALILDAELDIPSEALGQSLRPPPSIEWPLSASHQGAFPGERPWGGGAPAALPPARDGGWLSGMASFYSQRFHGRPTASGEPYLSQGWTAAHRDLPLDTLLSVRNPANGVEVVVRVNDRGPFHSDRMVDLSMAAAQALGLLKQGVAMVVIRPLSADEADRRALGPQPSALHQQASAFPLLVKPNPRVGRSGKRSSVVKGEAGKPRTAAAKPARPSTKAKRSQPKRR